MDNNGCGVAKSHGLIVNAAFPLVLALATGEHAQVFSAGKQETEMLIKHQSQTPSPSHDDQNKEHVR